MGQTGYAREHQEMTKLLTRTLQGDYKSFITHMRQKSDSLNVDLLVVDTGDLHDGNGDTDATSPNGVKALPIYEQLDYDLLTIGNHELYLSDIGKRNSTSSS